MTKPDRLHKHFPTYDKAYKTYQKLEAQFVADIARESIKHVNSQGRCKHCGKVCFLDDQGFCDPKKGFSKAKLRSRACKAQRILIATRMTKQKEMLAKFRNRTNVSSSDFYDLVKIGICAASLIFELSFYLI